MRRSPRRILESACSVTPNLTRTSSATVSVLRGAPLPTLDDAEDGLSPPSAFFTLPAGVDVSEHCRKVEVDVDVEEVERVAAEADWGM